ncbi:MAG: OmpA family protein, partial [Phaeodactylibacter sp.]|nr:OmpA family protein [Phaeodactylibacter sp.]
GSEEDNQLLSENRAKAVYDFLVEKGIPEERLQYKGYGESKPIATNYTAEGRQQNRRTEFEVVREGRR